MKHRLFASAALIAAAVGTFMLLRSREGSGDLLMLYSNVDIREVQVAFNDSDRIVRMFVPEGDFVRPGELLAELDSRRYAANADQTRHTVEAQKQVLTRLLGSVARTCHRQFHPAVLRLALRRVCGDNRDDRTHGLIHAALSEFLVASAATAPTSNNCGA